MDQRFEDEISLKDVLQKIRSVCTYLFAQWNIILLLFIFGAGIGVLVASFKKPLYSARVTFIAEEGSSAGSLASLAGQFGLDLGGGSSTGGILALENLLLFIKSEGLIRETLLTPYDSTQKITLADKYAEFEEYQKAWKEDEDIGAVSFSSFTVDNLPLKEESLLRVIITSVNQSLSVNRPGKKASFIEVKVTSQSEKWSKIFVERLVSTATQRYIMSKTKVKADNVALLQKRADSLGALLNSTTYTAAASQQILVDANPALRTAPVNAEISTRQKMMLATIFGEVVKNLELAKFSLSQETPVIQIVDRSYLPLKLEKKSKFLYSIAGGFLAGVLAIMFLLTRRWYRQLMST